MVTELRRSDLLPADIPAFVLVLIAAVAVAAWVGAHWFKRRMTRPWQRWAFLAVQVSVGTAAAWSLFQVAGRFVVLGTTWSLASLSLLTAAAAEGALALYELERSMIPRPVGRVLAALRLLMIFLLAAMLSQPILRWEMRTDITRYAAVLLDDSASMHVSDRVPSPTEKLKLAAFFDLKAVRGRPRVDAVAGRIAGFRDKLAREGAAIQAIPEADTAAFEAALRKPDGELGPLLKEAARALAADEATVGRMAGAKGVPRETEQAIEDIRARLKKTILPALADASGWVSGKTAGGARERRQGLLKALNGAGDEMAQVLALLPPAVARWDETFYAGLTPADRKAVDDTATRTRASIAYDVLSSRRSGEKSLLDRLKAKYSVSFIRFASEPVATDVEAWLKNEGRYVPPLLPATAGKEDKGGADESLRNFQEATDIGAALARVSRDAMPESLAGVLVLTDGRHNGRVAPEPAARQVAILGGPVCSVVIGSTETPRDAAILDVVTPVSVYLGDKVNVQAILRFDALRGKKARVRLLHDGRPVDETTVDLPEDKFRTSVSLGHTPPAVGIYDYEVEIEPLEGELLTSNNQWRFRVAASDNRIQVLLVDGQPRWEFRYLRNLLYARDRAVQLQYVLMEPDRLADAPAPRTVYASTARKFGDSEATALPKNREEWMKFDVIILGDVPPSVLDDATLKTIRHCIAERGAILIVIAGPRFMPHWHTSPVFREMMPIRYAQSETSCFASPEPFYGIRLTADGSAHPVMQQSGNAQENRQIWEGFPPLVWRHAVAGVKEGASVLAYAEPVDAAEGAGARREPGVAGSRQKETPLVVAQPYGLGRVVALTFDQTWRLRYRKGDVHHHKFWGQVLRWGAGDKLRSGTTLVRIGTDRLTYPVNSRVHVETKVLDTDFKAVTDETITVNVVRDKKSIVKKKLQYRSNSCGIYETTLPPLPEAGLYRVVLESEKVSSILAAENVPEVSTEFIVSPAVNSVEFAELSAGLETPGRMAAASGGVVVGPEAAERILDVFGPGSRTLSEMRELTLWDRWPLLVLMILVVTAEWLVRRKKGMA